MARALRGNSPSAIIARGKRKAMSDTKPAQAGGGAAPRQGKGLRVADISFDEQVEIIGQINEAMERNRIQIRPDTFVYTAKRRGSPIPILINLLALVTLAVGAFVLFRYFQREEQSLIKPPAAVVSAEGLVLETFRRESEKQLGEKDQEISAIRRRLEELRREAAGARLESEAQVRRREVELKAELARQLEAERRRLQESGAANVEEQIRALERRLQGENQRSLEQFRAQASQELAAKEQEIAEREARYRQELQKFQQERSALEQQLREQVTELEARRRQETGALESERSRTAQELASLQETRRKEQAALDQLAGSYTRVASAMRSRQYDAALGELAALEGFLGQEAIVALPAVQGRLGVERFVISSLRALIDRERTPAAGAGAEGARAQALLAAVAAAAAEADRLARAGDSAGAQRYYQSAVDQIPETRQSSAWLVDQARKAAELASESSSEATRRLRAELDQARVSLRQQTHEASRLKAALDRSQSQIDQQAEELARLKAAAGEQNRELSALADSARRQAARAEQAGTLQSRYAGAAAPAGQAAVPQARVLELVDTKIKLREVVSSEPVKSQYPSLARDLEDYFEVYGNSQTRVGQEEALRDANAVLDSLLGRGAAPNAASLKGRYYAPAADPFGRYLEKLVELLR